MFSLSWNENTEIHAEVCRRLKQAHGKKRVGFVTLVQKDPKLAIATLAEVRAEKAREYKMQGLRVRM